MGDRVGGMGGIGRGRPIRARSPEPIAGGGFADRALSQADVKPELRPRAPYGRGAGSIVGSSVAGSVPGVGRGIGVASVRFVIGDKDGNETHAPPGNAAGGTSGPTTAAGGGFSIGRTRAISAGSTCRQCGEPGHFARECPQKGGGFGASNELGGFGGGARGRRAASASRDGGCYSCGQAGHVSRDCPESGKSGTCYNCGKSGHISRNCPEKNGGADGDGAGASGNAGGGGGFDNAHDGGGFGKSGGGGFDTAHGGGGFSNAHGGDAAEKASGRRLGPDKVCHKCKNPGHFLKDCPEKQSDKCFNCNKPGHFSKDCTEPRDKPAGKGPSTYVPSETPVDDLWQCSIPVGEHFERYYDDEVMVSGPNVNTEKLISFENADFPPELQTNITKAGFKRPTPIQQSVIPLIMNEAGRDLMVCAFTGSGKTAAYVIPIVARLMKEMKDMKEDIPPLVPAADQASPLVLVVLPTRELACQIWDEFRKLTNDTNIKTAIAYGGTAIDAQKAQLKRGCHVLVATPGRLLDFVSHGLVSLSRCRFLVLDEADRMLDMGFEPEVSRLIEEMPDMTKRLTMLFSATFAIDVQRMACGFLNDHIMVSLGTFGSANRDIEQKLIKAAKFEKMNKLMELLRGDKKICEKTDESKNLVDRLLAIIRSQDMFMIGWTHVIKRYDRYLYKTMVFAERKRNVDMLAAYISQAVAPATSIHGDRAQKEREEALVQFKRGMCPILVATSVCERGLDIPGVDHVINYDLPQTIEEYIQRIGRTGRLGNRGRATSFFDSETDGDIAKELQKVFADAEQELPEWFLEELRFLGNSVTTNDDVDVQVQVQDDDDLGGFGAAKSVQKS